MPSPDHNQIGAVMQGRAAHDACRAPTLKAHFQIGSSLSLQYGDALAGPDIGRVELPDGPGEAR